MIRCPNCGESNEPGSRFCFNCGANLAAAEPSPQPPPAFPPPPPAFPPPGRAEHEAERRSPPDQPDQAPRPSIPPQYQPPAYGVGWGPPPGGQRSGWAAIDEMDPPPPPKRRATWLMVILGIVAGCLLVCVGTFIFALTPPGQDTFEELGTVVAEFATEAAPEPTREP